MVKKVVIRTNGLSKHYGTGGEIKAVDELDLEELMKEDVISAMMEEFGEIAPSVKTVLIHERDTYIAKKISDESKKGKVVAVVGAGHLKGIQKELENQKSVVIEVFCKPDVVELIKKMGFKYTGIGRKI